MGRKNQKSTLHCSFCGKTKEEVDRLIAGKSAQVCSECIKVCVEMLKEVEALRTKEFAQTEQKGLDDAKKQKDLPKPFQIKEYLDTYVIGQERTKKVLSVAVYNHYKRVFLGVKQSEEKKEASEDIELDKSNVLLIGPTGCGKTLLAHKLANFLNVPFIMVDATTLTDTGYVGEDVDSIVHKLLQRCDYEVDSTERAIVYIDEIDKISRRRGNNLSTTHDPSGEAVQQALLKLIEGTIVSVPQQGQRKYTQGNNVEVSTKDMLFICGGAFADLDKVILNRTRQASIGFGAMILGEMDQVASSDMLEQVEPEDLIKYGLIPEFVGRLPIVSTLKALSEEDLVTILTEPKDAIVKQYQKLFEMEGVAIEFMPETLRAVAKIALDRKTGARGLRSVIEGALLDTMYDLPSIEGLERVVIEESVILHKQKPILVYRPSNQSGIEGETNAKG